MGTMVERFGGRVDKYSGRSRHGRYVSQEDREKFIGEWTTNMVAYWRERIDLQRAIDTGNLRSQIEGALLLQSAKTTITFRFPMYGKYLDEGTGREFPKKGSSGYTDRLGRHYDFKRGGEGTTNSGQLPFMDESYREEHGLNKPKRVGPAWGGRIAGGHFRQPKDWYWRKYYSSRMVLNELERDYYGSEYQGLFTTALDTVMGQMKWIM